MAALDFPSSPTPGQTYTSNGKTWTYDSTTGSWVASNIVTVPISTGVSGLGTGVATALGVNVGSAGAFVVNGGALGTPSSGTLTSCTGLPISTGVSGLGTGVATALGVNIGSAGAPVLFNGAGGTPTSLTLTNATGLPLSTGITGFGANVATFLATPSSANLLSAVTDETGSGALVFGTTPTFTTSALFPDGTAALPSIAHAGDTNCGFWFPSADTIAASTAGAERMRITSGGLVGIGTSSVATAIHVSTTDQSNCRLRLENTGVSGRTWDIVSGNPGVSNINFTIYDVTAAATRLSIDAAGRLGIGATPSTTQDILIGGNSTGNTTQYGVLYSKTTQSDVTGTQIGFTTSLATAAAAFTLSEFRHFSASFNTIGAGSTVTSQYGFYASSGLTGATNNYGFYSNIAAATGRYNFYSAGSASNYFAGAVGIGISPVSALDVVGSIYSRGAAAAGGILVLSADVTSGANGCTVESSYASGGYGPLIIKTSATERMRIAADGTVGINSTTAANIQLYLGGTAPSSVASSYSYYTNQTIPSTSTNIGADTLLISTAAASFTCTSLTHFAANQGTFGAGSAVTNQYGFYASANLVGAASNNFGYWSGIAAATGRWNFYAAGTADNYFAGNVGIGTTSFGTSASKVLALGNATAPASGPADTLQIYSSDLSAGNTMLSLYTEGTPVNANTTAATTHRIAIRVNGTVYYLLANTAA